MDRPRATTKTASGEESGALLLQTNRLLARLPAEELSLINAVTTLAQFKVRQTIYERDEPIRKIYFPITGLGSLLTTMKNESAIEAMTVGREGMLGLPFFHGVTTHRSKAICQIAGDFASIGVHDFKLILRKAPALTRMLHRYGEYCYEVLAQGIACNSTHVVEQRCARWILVTSASIDQTTFKLTQEFLSQMLAVRRPGVTVAIAALEKNALISHHYGSITILDFEGLKKAACECFETIRGMEQDLLDK